MPFITISQPQEHDSYSGFRSQKLDVDFKLDVLPSTDKVSVNALFITMNVREGVLLAIVLCNSSCTSS